METELPPACGTCCGVAACGMPHRGGSSFLCQLELCGAVNRPRPWVLLTTVASHFQGSALNPSGSVGSFPFLVVGSEGNSSECQLCNTCSRHHQELSSYFGPCLIVWSVMEQNNSSPGYFLEEAAGPWRQSQFSVICVCDNQGTLGTCPHMSYKNSITEAFPVNLPFEFLLVLERLYHLKQPCMEGMSEGLSDTH